MKRSCLSNLAFIFCFSVWLKSSTILAQNAAPPVSDLDPGLLTNEKVLTLADKQDFDSLNKIAERLRREKPRNPSGKWLLAILYEVLESGKSEKHPEKRGVGMGLLQKWMKKHPTSVTPRVAMVQLIINAAWDLRGGGYANTISDERGKAFQKELEKAWKLCEDAEKISGDDPELYAKWIAVAMGQGKSNKEVEAIFKKGVAVEKTYTNLYIRMGTYLLPRWHGDPGELEKFARKAVEDTRDEEGFGIYARIAVDSHSYVGTSEFLKDLRFGWPLIKHGFEDLQKAYPKSNKIPNQYCRMAGLHEDKETAKPLFEKIGTQWNNEVWNSESHFNRWKDWATKNAPFPGLGGLLYAAETGNIEEAKKLLADGKSLTHTDELGRTPLMAAIQEHRGKMVDFLLESGADPHAVNEYGITPLMKSVMSGDLQMVEKFIELKCDVNTKTNENRTPLLTATRENRLDLARVLLDHGADSNAGGNPNPTPLYWAASCGNLEMVQLLLSHGADPNKITYGNSTVLDVAANDKNGDVMRALLEMGAKPNTKSEGRVSPLLRVAIAEKWDLAKLLLEHGADPNDTDLIGWTPLMVAAWQGNVDGARLLIERGADVNKCDPKGWTPLHLAVRSESEDVLMYLLSQERITVTGVNEDKETVLHLAARKSSQKAIEMLLKKGADIHAKDSDDITPIADARIARRKDIEEFMLNYKNP